MKEFQIILKNFNKIKRREIYTFQITVEYFNIFFNLLNKCTKNVSKDIAE